MAAEATVLGVAYRAACLSREAFAVAFVDVARLGSINRHFGRTAGSRVLETVERVVFDSPSTERIACPLWGDQLFLAIPNVGSVERRMRALSRNLRQELTRVGLPSLRRPVHIGAARAPASIPVLEVIDLAADNLNRSKLGGIWLIVTDHQITDR